MATAEPHDFWGRKDEPKHFDFAHYVEPPRYDLKRFHHTLIRDHTNQSRKRPRESPEDLDSKQCSATYSAGSWPLHQELILTEMTKYPLCHAMLTGTISEPGMTLQLASDLLLDDARANQHTRPPLPHFPPVYLDCTTKAEFSSRAEGLRTTDGAKFLNSSYEVGPADLSYQWKLLQEHQGMGHDDSDSAGADEDQCQMPNDITSAADEATFKSTDKIELQAYERYHSALTAGVTGCIHPRSWAQRKIIRWQAATKAWRSTAEVNWDYYAKLFGFYTTQITTNSATSFGRYMVAPPHLKKILHAQADIFLYQFFCEYCKQTPNKIPAEAHSRKSGLYIAQALQNDAIPPNIPPDIWHYLPPRKQMRIAALTNNDTLRPRQREAPNALQPPLSSIIPEHNTLYNLRGYYWGWFDEQVIQGIKGIILKISPRVVLVQTNGRTETPKEQVDIIKHYEVADADAPHSYMTHKRQGEDGKTKEVYLPVGDPSAVRMGCGAKPIYFAPINKPLTTKNSYPMEHTYINISDSEPPSLSEDSCSVKSDDSGCSAFPPGCFDSDNDDSGNPYCPTIPTYTGLKDSDLDEEAKRMKAQHAMTAAAPSSDDCPAKRSHEPCAPKNNTTTKTQRNGLPKATTTIRFGPRCNPFINPHFLCVPFTSTQLLTAKAALKKPRHLEPASPKEGSTASIVECKASDSL